MGGESGMMCSLGLPRRLLLVMVRVERDISVRRAEREVRREALAWCSR
jgi:hypothetical protein